MVFLDSLAPLAPALGPVLLSFPHAAPDLARLDRVLAALAEHGEGVQAAFELKPDWHTPEVLRRLDRAGAALVVTDRERDPSPDGGMPSPGEVGGLAYVRLRRDRYDRAGLERWAESLLKARADGRDVYAFLKHDELGHGPRYARQLQSAVARLG